MRPNIRSEAAPRPVDINASVSWLLRDLAAIQSSRQKEFGYKRAASVVFQLDEPLTALWNSSGLTTKIPGIGPSSARVIADVLTEGFSSRVERAIDESGKRADITRRRALRSNFLSRSAVRAALAADGDGLRVADVRADFQMHSVWSDGSATLPEVASACRARGYQFAAITDHAHGLAIARGMSMTRARAQHRAIDRLNGRDTSFYLFKGIEANIAADGGLDLTDDEAAAFEIVLAAPHSKLRMADDQTARLLRVIDESSAHILAHPRGRMAGTRDGIHADWPRVFRAAAAAGVAVELDGDPWRQDVDHALAASALAAGCVFSLGSDAHGPSQLIYIETAVAHARLAGIPPGRVINAWDLGRLREWLARRRRRRGTSRQRIST